MGVIASHEAQLYRICVREEGLAEVQFRWTLRMIKQRATHQQAIDLVADSCSLTESESAGLRAFLRENDDVYIPAYRAGKNDQQHTKLSLLCYRAVQADLDYIDELLHLHDQPPPRHPLHSECCSEIDILLEQAEEARQQVKGLLVPGYPQRVRWQAKSRVLRASGEIVRPVRWIDCAFDGGLKTTEEVQASAHHVGCRGVLDVCSIALQFRNSRRLLAGVTQVKELFKVVEVKNRFREPTFLGWSDIMVYVELELRGGDKHIAQIMLHHMAYCSARSRAEASIRSLRQAWLDEAPPARSGALHAALLRVEARSASQRPVKTLSLSHLAPLAPSRQGEGICGWNGQVGEEERYDTRILSACAQVMRADTSLHTLDLSHSNMSPDCAAIMGELFVYDRYLLVPGITDVSGQPLPMPVIQADFSMEMESQFPLGETFELVAADPADCGTLLTNAEQVHGRVCLVHHGGDVSDHRKVVNVVLAGATGVVLVNHQRAMPPSLAMWAPIPFILVSQADGMGIRTTDIAMGEVVSGCCMKCLGNKSLLHVDLSHNPLVERRRAGRRAVLSGLESLCCYTDSVRPRLEQVQTLLLSHCHLGPEGLKILCRLLGTSKNLHTLDLRSNDLCYEGDMSGLQALGGALKKNRQGLHFLDLSNNNLMSWQKLSTKSGLIEDHTDSVGLYDFSDALGKHRTLHTLRMRNVVLAGVDAAGEGAYDESGAFALCTALGVNRALRSLDLAINQIGGFTSQWMEGDTGCNVIEARLNDAISNNQTLTDIDLRGTHMSVHAAGVVGRSLWMGDRLEKLCGIDFGEVQAQAQVQATLSAGASTAVGTASEPGKAEGREAVDSEKGKRSGGEEKKEVAEPKQMWQEQHQDQAKTQEQEQEQEKEQEDKSQEEEEELKKHKQDKQDGKQQALDLDLSTASLEGEALPLCEVALVAKTVSQMPSLSRLKLSENWVPMHRLRGGEASDVNFDLSNMSLCNLDCAVLREVIGANGTCQKLNLGSNDIGADGVSAFMPYLRQCTSLHSLDLRCNPLCGKQADGRGAYDDSGINTIGQQLPRLDSLFDLCLAGVMLCGVSLEGFGTFASTGIAALCRGLRDVATKLTSIDLSHNNLSGWTLRSGKGLPSAIQLLAIALQDPATESLAYLKLRECRIGPDGGKLLGDSMYFNVRLLSLDLTGNRMSGAGLSTKAAVSFARALLQNSTLLTLKLAGTTGSDRAPNLVGSKAAGLLAAGIKRNVGLNELDCSWNDFQGGEVRLQQACDESTPKVALAI